MRAALTGSQNFGLYGDRIGALSIVASHAEEAERLTSQLKVIVRAMYSSPPLQGARLVSRILGDERLRTMWKHECKFMAQRCAGVPDRQKRTYVCVGSSRCE